MERHIKTAAYAMVALAVAPVWAQTPAPGEASANLTHLHVSAEGSVSEPPDVLVGDLTAEATSPSAVEAQRKVNAMMAQGMRDAHGTEGIEARATGYTVNQVDLDEGVAPVRPHPRRMGWTAQQTLEVRGKDGDRLLSLVGKLQDEGLAVASLDWLMSPPLDARLVTERWSKRCRRSERAPTKRRKLWG